MKNIIVLFFVLISVGFSSHELSAQSAKLDTVTLQVPGVCNMCKTRIETASYDVAGVKSVNWDLDTEILTAVILKKKTSRQEIADALAKAGYKSELADADSEAYSNLPACCQYDSGVEKHGKQ